MAAESPPYALQAGSHSAQLFRQAISTLQGNRNAIVGSGDFKVAALGAPAMAVNVAGGVPGGQAWIKGTTTSGPQASYYCYNNATTELTIAAASAKKRIDSPIAQVKDAQYAGAENTFSLSVLKGTESEAPVEPSLPASSMRLANIKVEPATVKIENAAITDKRPQSAQYVIAAQSGSEPKTRARWGITNEAGAITAGSGDFTCTKLAVGEYEVVWTEPGGVNVPVAISKNAGINAIISLVENSRFIVQFWNGKTEKVAAQGFYFISLGG